jgi:hypothetical protein
MNKYLPLAFLVSLAGCSAQPSLVATWVHADASTQEKSTWTFAADGTFTQLKGKDMKSGRFSASNDTLVATTGDQTVTAPIYVNDQVFVFAALRPQGKHDGVIGGWSVTGALDHGAVPTPYDADWTFFEDGGAFASILDLDGKTHILRGTWLFDGVTTEYVTSMERDGQGTETHRFVFVDGQVMGEQVYAKQ